MNGRMRQPSHLRIGDAERESAVKALGEHYAAGRIDSEELDQRSNAAYAARTEAELWPLFGDLPPLPSPQRRGGATRSHQPSPSRSWSMVLPALLVVLALAMLTSVPWPILLLVGWLMLGRMFGRCSRPHTNGSRREVRGTWS